MATSCSDGIFTGWMNRLKVDAFLEFKVNFDSDLRAHTNRDKIEAYMSVLGIQGSHKNALIKSFEMSPYLICLWAK